MPMLLRLLLAAALMAAPTTVVACGEDDGGSETAPVLRVVATTTVGADLARSVAGDRAQVTSLMSANADPHAYELRPRDVDAISGAGLVVRSGGDLDDWLDEAVEQAAGEAPVVTLIDSVQTIEGGHEHEGEEHAGEEEAHAGEEEQHADEALDPHWWHDPRNAVLAVEAIEQALALVDPAHAADYRDRAGRYVEQIEGLDGAIAACWQQVPKRERKLVTTHDALGYYAKRYGLEVVGTVIPARTTQGQASAGELAELAETIRREQVRAVFAESSVNTKVEQAIADETGATLGKELWADGLGPEGSDGDTYLRSIAANTQAMIDGMTDGAASCALPAG